MKRTSLVATLAVGAIAGLVPTASSLATEDHKVLTAQEVKWSPAPPSLPKGAEIAVLFGDPSKDGLFAMRLKFPKGYQIAPHSHPKPEVVTVISGTFRIGMGDTADAGKAKPLPAGGFFAFAPGMTHFASTDEETIVQINSTGPWGLTYVNPKDDPRQKTQ
jgi:quercetin dioxygenase-like cupin family protein